MLYVLKAKHLKFLRKTYVYIAFWERLRILYYVQIYKQQQTSMP